MDDPGTYVFRGIVADCVRGLEFLLTRPELDPSRVVAVGNEMALATAALRDGLSHVVCTPGLFFEAARLATRTDAYPLEEINDYVRLHPEKKDAVHRTLSYFHPRMFAPRVGATTLLLAGAPGTPTDSQALRPLAKAFGGEVTVHESEHSSYKDGLFEKRWISDQLGFDEPVLPEAWR